eukprot:scaffold8235_cov113-Cylindrotheca_fusiformis.AAC.3
MHISRLVIRIGTCIRSMVQIIEGGTFYRSRPGPCSCQDPEVRRARYFCPLRSSVSYSTWKAFALLKDCTFGIDPPSRPWRTIYFFVLLGRTNNLHMMLKTSSRIATFSIRRECIAGGCFSTSSTSETSDPSGADVVQGPSLLRTSRTRSSPSLFFLPGLRSLPFWTSMDGRVAYGDPMVTHVVQHLEAAAKDIRSEYEAAQEDSRKLPPTNDYHDHPNSLHTGKWEWFSYLDKGNVQGNFVRSKDTLFVL